MLFWLQILNVADILLGPMLGAAKVSLVIQIRRYFDIQERPQRPFTIYAYSVLLVVAGYYFAIIFVAVFQCTPRKGLWDPTIASKCISVPQAVYVEGGFALLTDLLLFTLFAWLLARAGIEQLGGKALIGCIMTVALL